jgi:hypothetical protein
VTARVAVEEVVRTAEPARDFVATVAASFIERYANNQIREKTWEPSAF